MAPHLWTLQACRYTGLIEQFKLNSLLELSFLTQFIFCPARKAPININDKQSECSTQIHVYNINIEREEINKAIHRIIVGKNDYTTACIGKFKQACSPRQCYWTEI